MGLKLMGEVALDGSGFERGLEGMAHSVKGFIAGAFGLYGIEAMIHKTMETAKDLVVESKRLGIGVEQLQVLKQAAKENSTELGTLAKAFEKIDVARAKALDGSAAGMKMLGRFAQLGITQEDLKTKSAADLFTGKMHKAAEDMNQEDLAPILKDIIGRAFGEVIPVLKTDFGELEAKMRAFGTLMGAETAVGLKTLEDEFDLLSKIIVAQIGPAFLAFSQWLLHMAANSKALEGLDYLIRKAKGEAELPNKNRMSASAAHDAAVQALDYIQKTDLRKTTPEQFRAQWQDYYKNGIGNDKNPEYADFFGGDKSKTWTEENRYLNGLIQPVEDVGKQAEGASTHDFEGLRAGLAALEARIKAEAEKLNNPKRPTFNPPEPEEKPDKELKEKKPKAFHEKGDSLIKVGNFLGSSRSTIEDLGQKQVDLLKQIADNTRPQFTGGFDFNPSDDNFPIV